MAPTPSSRAVSPSDAREQRLSDAHVTPTRMTANLRAPAAAELGESWFCNQFPSHQGHTVLKVVLENTPCALARTNFNGSKAFGAAILHAASKYIANLDLYALRLSIFGGHVVLQNVELKLDVVRREFAADLPIKFERGFVRELRIRIPWLKLHSEPIEVTVDIVELVATLEGRDDEALPQLAAAEGAREARGFRFGAEAEGSRLAAAESRGGDGWMHHLVSKALVNAVLRVRNLVIKLRHAQSVATLSVRQLELLSTNALWQRAFVEPDGPSRCLRKLLEVADLTLCLDRRQVDGHVKHFYQPLLDRARCSLRLEAHLSPSQLPPDTPTLFFDFNCPALVMSVSEGQLLLLGELADAIGSRPPPRRQSSDEPPPPPPAAPRPAESDAQALRLEQWREAVRARAEAHRPPHAERLASPPPAAAAAARGEAEGGGVCGRAASRAWSVLLDDEASGEASPHSPSRALAPLRVSARHVCVLAQLSSLTLTLLSQPEGGGEAEGGEPLGDSLVTLQVDGGVLEAHRRTPPQPAEQPLLVDAALFVAQLCLRQCQPDVASAPRLCTHAERCGAQLATLRAHCSERRAAICCLPHTHALWEHLPSTVQLRLHHSSGPVPSRTHAEVELPLMLLVYDHAFVRELIRFFGVVAKQLPPAMLAPAADARADGARAAECLSPAAILLRRSDSEPSVEHTDPPPPFLGAADSDSSHEEEPPPTAAGGTPPARRVDSRAPRLRGGSLPAAPPREGEREPAWVRVGLAGLQVYCPPALPAAGRGGGTPPAAAARRGDASQWQLLAPMETHPRLVHGPALSIELGASSFLRTAGEPPSLHAALRGVSLGLLRPSAHDAPPAARRPPLRIPPASGGTAARLSRLSVPVDVEVTQPSDAQLHVSVPPVRLALAAEECAALALVISSQLDAAAADPAVATAATRRARSHRRAARAPPPPPPPPLLVRLHCPLLRLELMLRKRGGRLVAELQRASLRLAAGSRLSVRGLSLHHEPHAARRAAPLPVARAGRLLSADERPPHPQQRMSGRFAGEEEEEEEVEGCGVKEGAEGGVKEEEGGRVGEEAPREECGGEKEEYCGGEEECGWGGGEGGGHAAHATWGAAHAGEAAVTVFVRLAPLSVRLDERLLSHVARFAAECMSAATQEHAVRSAEALAVLREEAARRDSAGEDVEGAARERPLSRASSTASAAAANSAAANSAAANTTDANSTAANSTAANTTAANTTAANNTSANSTAANNTAANNTSANTTAASTAAAAGTPPPPADAIPFPELDFSDLRAPPPRGSCEGAEERGGEGTGGEGTGGEGSAEVSGGVEGRVGGGEGKGEEGSGLEGRSGEGSEDRGTGGEDDCASDDSSLAAAAVAVLEAEGSRGGMVRSASAEAKDAPPALAELSAPTGGGVTWQLQLSHLTLTLLAALPSGQCGAEVRLSLLTAKLAPHSKAAVRHPPLVSIVRRAQLGVSTLSLTLLRAAAHEGAPPPAAPRWSRLPLLAPTKARASFRLEQWRRAGVRTPASDAVCLFVEVDVSHLFVRLSPVHVSIAHAIWAASVAPFASLAQPSPAAAEAPHAPPHAPPHAEPPSPEELAQQFSVREAAGGRPGVQQLAHSAAGGAVAWLTWRHAVPHVVRRLVVDTRRSARSARLVPRAVWGAQCELSAWDVVNEAWEVCAAAPMRKAADGWRVELPEPRNAAAAWEWQLRILPADGAATGMPGGAWFVGGVRLLSVGRHAEMPRLLLRVSVVHASVAVAASGLAPRVAAHEEELGVASLVRAKQRLAVYPHRGWRACHEVKLGLDLLDLDDLTLEPLLAQTKLRVFFGCLRASALPPRTRGKAWYATADCAVASLHLGPAALRLLAVAHALRASRRSLVGAAAAAPPAAPRGKAHTEARAHPHASAAPPDAAPVGALVHFANKIVNLTPLELVFAQVGAPSSQTHALPANAEVGHSWRLLSPPLKGAAAVPAAAGGALQPSRGLRFRLADDWHWSEAVDLRARLDPLWLTLGPADGYFLLLLRFEEIGLQRVLTLTPSHAAASRLPLPLRLRLECNGKSRPSRQDSPAAELQLSAGSAPAPLLLSFSRHAVRSHSLLVCRADDRAPAVSTLLQVPLPPLASIRKQSARDLGCADEVEQLVSLGVDASCTLPNPPSQSCWFTTHSSPASPDTVLMFSPPLRVLNGSRSKHLSYRVDCGAQRALDSGCVMPRCDAPVILFPHEASPLTLWLQFEGYTWCEPQLVLSREDMLLARGSTRQSVVTMRDCSDQPVRLQLHIERAKSCDGAELRVVLLAPFEIVNLCEHALAMSCSLDLGVTLRLPPRPADRAVASSSIFGTWGRAYDPAGDEHKFLIRFSATSNGDDCTGVAGAVLWSRFVTVEQPAILSLPLEDEEEVLYAVLSCQSRYHCGVLVHELSIRPGLELSSSASWPLRVNVCGFPFYHSLPPTSPGCVVSLEKAQKLRAVTDSEGRTVYQPWLAVRVCVEEDVDRPCDGPATFRDEQADEGGEEEAHVSAAGLSVWQWSDEIDLQDAQLGVRQRVVLQSDRFQLRTLICELRARPSGVRRAHFLDDHQPPVKLVNHTAHTLFFWGWAAQHGEVDSVGDDISHLNHPECDSFAVGPGLDGACCFKGCHEGCTTWVRIGMQPDSFHLSSRAFKLSPPRVMELELLSGEEQRATLSESDGLRAEHLSVAVAQCGPTCTIRCFPACAAPLRCVGTPPPPPPPPPSGLSVQVTVGRLSVCLWEVPEARGPTADKKPAPLLHLWADQLRLDARRAAQPSSIPEKLELHLAGGREGTAGSLVSLHATAGLVQCDSWLLGRSHVVLSADAPTHLGGTPPNGSRMARFSAVWCKPDARGPSFVQLLDIQVQPLALNVDDTLLRRGRRVFEALISCRRRAAATLASAPEAPTALAQAQPTCSGKPPAVEGGAEGTAVGWHAEPVLADASPAPWLFIERLYVGQLAITLTVSTGQIVPMHVGTHRTPLHFEPLVLSALNGSHESLLSLIAAHYASAALAHSAALIGSLQLLGNPTWLIRSIAAGLRDALSMPLRGLSEGPRQFVYGLGAGASSLFLHLSHGALTSLSGFTGALAANLGAEPIFSRRALQSHVAAPAPAALLQSRARVPRTGWDFGSRPDAGPRLDNFRGRSSASRLVLGASHGLLSAVRRPVGGALRLVSEASQSLMHSVSAPMAPAPLPQGAACSEAPAPSAVMLQRKVLPTHEAYQCHVHASPMTPLCGGAEHVLLLSSSALYVLLPEHSIPVLTLPMHQVERLEVAPNHAAELANDGSNMLAIFLYPAEAQRLGIPSCVQYLLTADASHLLTSVYEQNQMVLATSFMKEPAWLHETLAKDG